MKKCKILSIIFVIFMVVGCGNLDPEVKEIKDLSAKEISKAKQDILDMEDNGWSFHYVEYTETGMKKKKVYAKHSVKPTIGYSFEDDKVVSISYNDSDFLGYGVSGFVYYPGESNMVDNATIKEFEKYLSKEGIDKEEIDAVILWYYKEKHEPIDSVKAKLVGEWETTQSTRTTYYSFGEDGRLTVKILGKDYIGTYTIDNSTIFGDVISGKSQCTIKDDYRLDDNQLIVGCGSDRIIYQKKIIKK